jgi:hypothetical protein
MVKKELVIENFERQLEEVHERSDFGLHRIQLVTKR